jgi:hypothetical protein
MDSQLVGIPMSHRVAMRPKPGPQPWHPKPWLLLAAVAAHTPELPLPPPEDEDLPVAKRPRLQAPTRFSNVVDRVTVSASSSAASSPLSTASLSSAAPCVAYRRSWKEEEDIRLIGAIQKLGKASWAAVAVMVSNRSSVQCRRRWLDVLDPDNRKKGRWVAEEDAKLVEAIEKYGKDWTRVAEMVPGRTNVKCRERWVGTVDPAKSKNGKHCVSWKAEEDAKLRRAVKKYDNNWVSVAWMVPGRTDRQCRSRWTLVLDPAYENKGKWTAEENAKLVEAVRRHGNSWIEVATLVPGRTSHQCRIRWVGTVVPAHVNNGKIPRRSWKPEEDAKLAIAVKKHGKKWVKVAAMVPDRRDGQCRLRWKTLERERNGAGNGEALDSVTV